jgi:FKBP-type peptidyl-prolyl cis-trans isomerase FklB
MKKLLFMLLATLFLSNSVWAADELKLKDENDKVNYSIGYQIGGDFVKQSIELKPEAIVKGMQDAIKANKPLLTQEEMNKTLIDLK